MFDNIFSAVLTFGLMAAGTVAVGSEMIGSHRSAVTAPTAFVKLDKVTVVGHRPVAVVDTVTLPMVTVTGRRSAWAAVAVENHEPAPKVE